MDFGRVLGGQVGAKLAPKSIKMESKMTSKKEVEIKRGKALFGDHRRGSGDPQGGGFRGREKWINGLKGRKLIISTRQWALGPANFYIYIDV